MNAGAAVRQPTVPSPESETMEPADTTAAATEFRRRVAALAGLALALRLVAVFAFPVLLALVLFAGSARVAPPARGSRRRRSCSARTA